MNFLRGRKSLPLIGLDLAYGFAATHEATGRHDSFVDFDPLRRHALAARMSWGVPRRFSTPWMARAFTPLFSAGVSADFEHHQGLGAHDVQRYGGEFIFANVVSVRRGYLEDGHSGIHGQTHGLGLGLNLGRIAGARWDWAQVPQGSGLSDLNPRGFTAWVDPLAVVSALRRRAQ